MGEEEYILHHSLTRIVPLLLWKEAREVARLRARGKGNAACGRDGHTAEHLSRVNCTAFGGS